MKKHTVVWPCGKNAGLYKTKTGYGNQKGERRGRGRPRRTWEDGVMDAARRKAKTLADMKRLAGDRIAVWRWTENQTLQGTRDK
jgi:hypothetical protein